MNAFTMGGAGASNTPGTPAEIHHGRNCNCHGEGDNAPGMTPVEIIKEHLARGAADDDGNRLEPLPGLTEEQLAAFETRIGFTLPPYLRELLLFCNGFGNGPGIVAGVDFSSSDEAFALDEESGFGWKTIGFAADGRGNHWGYVLGKGSRELGPVYYFSHDPPVFLYQASGLAGFLVEMFKLCDPPHESAISAVHGDELKNVWVENPGYITVENARASSDPVLADFARSLPDHWKVMDLRNPHPGDGFSWGRCRDFRRHDEYPVFGMDFKQPGWLTRFLRKFTNKA